MSDKLPLRSLDVESGNDETKKVETLNAKELPLHDASHVMSEDNVFDLKNFYRALPNDVKRRVKALKKLQFEMLKIDAECCRAEYQLEKKCAAIKDTIHEKRKHIVTGDYEPNDDDCHVTHEDDDDDDYDTVDEEESDDVRDENVKGIPQFWLTILKNIDIIADFIEEHDEPILRHLIDVKLVYDSIKLKFTLEFHFSPNDYFNDIILTKEYEFICEVETEDPWSFEGLKIVSCKGCPINWKKGKNVTEKTIVKKQKHKSKGHVRTVTKTVKTDSFFNYFSKSQSLIDSEDSGDDNDDDDNYITDFEIGELFRTSIIPRAVLFFTGDALDDDYDYESSSSNESDSESAEDDDDDDTVEGKVNKK